MKRFYNYSFKLIAAVFLLSVTFPCFPFVVPKDGQTEKYTLRYTISMENPSSSLFHVDLYCPGWQSDTIILKMPEWMPGYYQIMDYWKEVQNLTAKVKSGENLRSENLNAGTWQLVVKKNTSFSISYDLKADRRFVANNWLDSTHAYIVTPATFLYIEDHINTPVSVKVNLYKSWKSIATGLDSLPGKKNEYFAPDFDVLYDCPILAGNLEEFPPFEVYGIKHRFIAYNPGTFDRNDFMLNLKKVVKAAIDIIGKVPYRQYTFIGIGPGYGGIEHLNNTTVSFSVKGLQNKTAMTRTLNFLAHEFFHSYNVKCIRPFELGPFDYGRENRTDLLWVSEGLTVYYEYMIVRRAGLINDQELFSDFESNINALENNPGRLYQSLIQSSYNTWSDGPFGNQGKDAGKTISYYDKGPIIGWILDLSIRNATANKRSLDDVMRFLYSHYYLEKYRGFTDAEFQQACEDMAGISLNKEFEYVYTTKEIDYNAFMSLAGLKINEETDTVSGKKKISISKVENPDPIQETLLMSWLAISH